MKFRQATITALVAVFSMMGTTTTAAPQRRQSLHAKNSHAATTTTTHQNTTASASVLAAQTGTVCLLRRSAETGLYSLDLHHIHPVTTLFEERPGRLAGTLPTANFTATFAATFGADLPNAAVTIMGGTGHQDTAVLIVILSDPSMSVESGGITYTVAQSSSQAGVLSLDSFHEGQGTSSDNSCSIFIDALKAGQGFIYF